MTVTKEHQRLVRLLGPQFKHIGHYVTTDKQRIIHYGYVLLKDGRCFVGRSTWSPGVNYNAVVAPWYDEHEMSGKQFVKEFNKESDRLVIRLKKIPPYNRKTGFRVAAGRALQSAALATGVMAETFQERVGGHDVTTARKDAGFMAFRIDTELPIGPQIRAHLHLPD